jgi:hypothetical protein
MQACNFLFDNTAGTIIMSRACIWFGKKQWPDKFGHLRATG